MDQKLQEYLESLVAKVLQAPALTNLSEQEKGEFAQKVHDYFNKVILDTTIDLMDEEQLNSIKDLAMDSPEMEQKIMEISSQIPSLAQILEEKLNKEVENIQNNPQFIG